MTERLAEILISSFPRLVLYCFKATIPLTVCIYALSLVLAFVLAVTNILCPFMVKFILTKHPADEQPKVSGNTPSTSVK